MIWLYLLTLLTLIITYGQEPEPAVTIPNGVIIASPLFDSESGTYIDDNCSFGTIIYKIGHAINIEHEQSRADRYLYRDSRLTININEFIFKEYEIIGTNHGKNESYLISDNLLTNMAQNYAQEFNGMNMTRWISIISIICVILFIKNGCSIRFICFLIFFYIRLPLIAAHSEFDHDHVVEEFIGEGDTVEIIFGEHLHYKYTSDGRMMINDCEVIGKLGHGLAGDFKRWTDMDLPRRRLNPYYAIGSWPNGDVCYEIDTDSFIADPWDNLLWNEVVNEYSTKTGINLIEKGTVSPCINPNYWIRIYEGGSCWSYVGQVSNTWTAIWVDGAYAGQPLSLGYGCQYLHIVVHELGHAIGMEHTQTRSDRDDWVTIHWDNIQAGKESIRPKVPICGWDVFIGS